MNKHYLVLADLLRRTRFFAEQITPRFAEAG